MTSQTLDLLLVVLFASVALCIVSLVLLRSTAREAAPSRDGAFARGTVWPYTALVAVRAKFFLPWVSSAQITGAGLAPLIWLWLARVGAYVAVASLGWLAALALFGGSS